MRNFLLSALLLMTGTVVTAQVISGNVAPTIDDPFTYSYSDGFTYFDFEWYVNNGSVISTWNTGNTYYASIKWTATGSDVISVGADGGMLPTTLNVSIGLPVPTPSFTFTYNCGSTTITRTSNPPSSLYEWWWQAAPKGTSSAYGSGSSLVITTTANWFLRTREIATGIYTVPATLAIGSVTVHTTIPATPTVANHAGRFGPGEITVSVGAVTGATGYNWYTEESGGTPIAGVTTNTYAIPNLEATDTLYVAAVQNGCISTNRIPVIATVAPLPQVEFAEGSNNRVIMGVPVTLKVSQAYTSYSWKNVNDVEVSTSPEFSTLQSGSYTVTVTKTGVTGSATSSAFPVTSGAEGQDRNYIVTNTIQVEGITNPDTIVYLPVEKNAQSIQYFDGLGRLVQSVVTQGSPLKKDIVQPVYYDGYGRESRKYLPYVATGFDGWYKTSAFDHQQGFYDPLTGGTAVARDTMPYAETIFEPSPLNRVLKQGAPGAAWQPDSDKSFFSTDKTIKYAYEFNDTSEVLLWTYTYPDTSNPFGKVNADTSGTPVYYAKNQLYKNMTKDEEGNRTISYVDRRDRIILKRFQVTSDTIVNDINYASTYFIYDDFDNLVCQIQPEGVKNLSEFYSAGDLGREKFLGNWAFRYKYDSRGRLIEKKIPGAGLVFIVLDKRDRVVMSQDGNQRVQNLWTFTKYDAHNRPIITGVYHHDDSIGQAQMTALISTTNFSEAYNGSSSFHGYTNTVFPTTNADSTALEIFTVTYYDDYIFRDAFAGSNYNYVPEDLPEQDTVAFTRVIGSVTGMKSRIIGSPDFLWNVNYYDKRHNLIQIVAQNHKGE